MFKSTGQFAMIPYTWHLGNTPIVPLVVLFSPAFTINGKQWLLKLHTPRLANGNYSTENLRLSIARGHDDVATANVNMTVAKGNVLCYQSGTFTATWTAAMSRSSGFGVTLAKSMFDNFHLHAMTVTAAIAVEAKSPGDDGLKILSDDMRRALDGGPTW